MQRRLITTEATDTLSYSAFIILEESEVKNLATFALSVSDSIAHEDTPRTITELAMSQFSAEIRRSPGWWKCCPESNIKNAWFDSAVDRTWRVKTPSSHAEVKLSARQYKIDYILDELQGYAALRDEKHQCQVSCFERVWESESVLDEEISLALRQSLDKIKALLQQNEDNITTDIIDHQRYPLVYNRTLVSHLNGRNYRSIPPPPSTDIYTVSPTFALLPSDVFVSADCSSVEFLSYINNLDPTRHSGTYVLLQKLLAGFMPLFEHTLTDLHRNNPLVQRIPGSCRYTVWEEPEPPDHSDDDEGWVNYEREMRQWALNRPINLPDVPSTGYPGGLENRRHTVTLRNRVVQVIAFLGMWKECGDNITNTSIQFRMAVTYPKGFSAGDAGATLRTWGIRDGDSCHQYIGEVPVRPGLGLVFPNIYQHRQTSFELRDPSKQGHMTVIRFFLVDPEIRPIVSTSVVAPQQKDWIHKALDDNLDNRLPNEVIEKILNNVEGLMDESEADSYKKELLEARKRFTRASNSYHFCIPFDIWNGPEVVP
ncbi:hypothetical protein NLJ89_g3614 [Agrocybe chaxingu]|uniref:DUF4246 domain-containing protein n=1 Tax=Agrocybe chaxingu TaxID=84603 RepID=A0A9W8K9P9_9AGAR|nr:hypothetical protein NLJ89_g3614 [Agrocybe chaxingu]